MKKTFIFLLSMLLLGGMTGIKAQKLSLENFQALQSYGQIPEDVLNSIRGIDPGSTNADSTVNGKQARVREKFRVMSNYCMNDLLTGGHVVFGDPIGEYVNKVADTLLGAYPDLRRQLHFYVTKSVAANAYSTDEGLIFINIGLISRLQNEAQLAFVLAHEIVHYVKKHNIRIYTEKQKAYARGQNRDEYKSLSLSEKVMRVNYHSKEIESIADHDAVALYVASSPYDAEEVKTAFDVLLYSAYPFTNEPFNLSLLETKTMVLPDYYLIDDVTKLQVDENAADSLSTHPSVRKRKEMMQHLIDSIPEFGTRKFINSEAEFKYVVNLAKFEVLRQLIIDHNLVEALFCASSVMHEFPDNVFVKKCIAASLYGISRYKDIGETRDILDYYKDVDGEMAQVNFMISKMNRRDLNIIALNYVWRLHMQIPNDAYISEICDDLFSSMVTKNSVKKSFFYDKSLAQLRLEASQNATVPDTIASTTRYRKKKSGTSKIDTTFTKFAFVDIINTPEFSNEFQKWEKKSDEDAKARDLNESIQEAMPGKTVDVHKTSKKDRVYVKNFVMADPYIVKIDKRNRDEIKYDESTVSASLVKKLMVDNARIAKLQMNLASPDGLKKTEDVKDYNDMSFINEYITERSNQSEEGMLKSFCKPYIDSIMKQSNSSYLAWMGVSSVQKKKPIARLCVMSILPYMWPYTIYNFIKPNIFSSYYYILFDVKSGNAKFAAKSVIRSDFHNDQINAHIYDLMYQIKKTYEK